MAGKSVPVGAAFALTAAPIKVIPAMTAAVTVRDSLLRILADTIEFMCCSSRTSGSWSL
jgi:hypothetical protein